MEMLLLIPTADVRVGRAVLRALDDLAAAGLTDLRAAVLVERTVDGRWYVPHETENVFYRGTFTAGAIGALIGLLAGPGSLFLGGAAGLLVGSTTEIGGSVNAETIVHAIGRLVPPGTVVVVCDLLETTDAAVDGPLADLDVTAWRMARGEAEAQLEAALRR